MRGVRSCDGVKTRKYSVFGELCGFPIALNFNSDSAVRSRQCSACELCGVLNAFDLNLGLRTSLHLQRNSVFKLCIT